MPLAPFRLGATQFFYLFLKALDNESGNKSGGVVSLPLRQEDTPCRMADVISVDALLSSPHLSGIFYFSHIQSPFRHWNT